MKGTTKAKKKDEDLKKERHKTFIQEQLDHRNKIDEETILVQQTLIKKNVTYKLLEISIPFLSPKAYEEIAEERSLLKLCGNCVCNKLISMEEKKNSILSSQKPKFYLSSSEKKIFDYEQVSWFCSEQCYIQYQNIYSILSSETLYTRTHQFDYKSTLQNYKDEKERKKENMSNNDTASNLNQLKNADLFKREIEMLGRELNNINFTPNIKEIVENNEEKIEEEVEKSEFEKWLTATIKNNEFNALKSSFDSSYMHEIHSDDSSSDDNSDSENKKRKKKTDNKPVIELSLYAQLFELLSGWKTKKTIRFLKQDEVHKEVAGFVVDREKEEGEENAGKFLYVLPLIGNEDMKKESLFSQMTKEIGDIAAKLNISKEYCYNIVDNIVSTFNFVKAVQVLPQQYVRCISMILIHLVALKNGKLQASIESNKPYVVCYLRANKLQYTDFQYLLKIFE